MFIGKSVVKNKKVVLYIKWIKLSYEKDLHDMKFRCYILAKKQSPPISQILIWWSTYLTNRFINVHR